MSVAVGTVDVVSHAPVKGGLAGDPPPLNFDMVQHMIHQAEKTAEAKLDSLQQSINAKLSRLDHMPTMWQIVGSVASGVIAGALAIIAIVSYASDRFDGGVGLGTEISDRFIENKLDIERNAARDAETRDQVDRLVQRMDQIIARLDMERPSGDNENNRR